jgi:hypothetical protein
MPAATTPDLATAFDRIDDFLAVQGSAPACDAVLALEAAVGLDDAARTVIRARVGALADAGHAPAAGSVVLGILVGLFAAEASA